MNQQPDKFFREKLHGYQKPASAEAWQRVSRNIRKENNSGMWLRIAAAVLLLVTGTLLIYPALQNKEQERIAGNETPGPRIAPETKKKDPAPEAPIAARETPEKKDQTPAEKRKPLVRKDKKTEAIVPPASSETPPVVKNDVEETVPAETEKADNLAHAESPSVAEEIHAQPKNVTIVFSAEEVNEKYLVKNTDAEATPNEKESSGLRKLLDKAYDLKHNQDPLGDLRQKKNEILAMNFKNDKRTQND